MKYTEAPLSGILVIEPTIFRDARGYFFETFSHHRYHELGIPAFVQDNISHSKKDVLRGLHYQLPNSQGKLVTVLRGSVWDVVVDIRRSSETFGKWFGIVLSEENNTQLYIPPGFAHGFCVLSEEADFLYKCTEYYSPTDERGLIWNDPDINISWPTSHPNLSGKDAQYSTLKKTPHDQLFA